MQYYNNYIIIINLDIIIINLLMELHTIAVSQCFNCTILCIILEVITNFEPVVRGCQKIMSKLSLGGGGSRLMTFKTTTDLAPFVSTWKTSGYGVML